MVTEAVPPGATALSFGVSLFSLGTLSADDLSLGDATAASASDPPPCGSDICDTTSPASSASSPASNTSASLAVSYSAADNPGGSGLARVDLYVKGPGDFGYTLAASSSGCATSGVFSYAALEGDGTYSFYTLATDTAGNTETAPSSAETTTLVDTTPPSSEASAPPVSNSAALTVAYAAADAASGWRAWTCTRRRRNRAATAWWPQTPAAAPRAASATPRRPETAATASTRWPPTKPATSRSRRRARTPPLSWTRWRPSSSASAPAVSGSTSLTISYTAADNAAARAWREVDLYAQGAGPERLQHGGLEAPLARAASATRRRPVTAATASTPSPPTRPATPRRRPAHPTPPPCSTPCRRPRKPAPLPSGDVRCSPGQLHRGGQQRRLGLGRGRPVRPGSGTERIQPCGFGHQRARPRATSATRPARATAATASTRWPPTRRKTSQATPATPDAATSYTARHDAAHLSGQRAGHRFRVVVHRLLHRGGQRGGSGLAEVDLYAKAPGQSSYTQGGLRLPAAAASGSFSYTAAGGDGSYSFYTIATDQAGNVEAAPATPDATTSVTVDPTPPSSSASSPALSASASLSVSYTAADNEGGSGLAEVDLYAKAPGAEQLHARWPRLPAATRRAASPTPRRPATAATASTRSPPTRPATSEATPADAQRHHAARHHAADLERRLAGVLELDLAERLLHRRRQLGWLGPRRRWTCTRRRRARAATARWPRHQRQRLGQLLLHRGRRGRQLQLLHDRHRQGRQRPRARPASPTPPRWSTPTPPTSNASSPAVVELDLAERLLHRLGQRGRLGRSPKSTCTPRRPGSSSYSKVASDTSGNALGQLHLHRGGR